MPSKKVRICKFKRKCYNRDCRALHPKGREIDERETRAQVSQRKGQSRPHSARSPRGEANGGALSDRASERVVKQTQRKKKQQLPLEDTGDNRHPATSTCRKFDMNGRAVKRNALDTRGLSVEEKEAPLHSLPDTLNRHQPMVVDGDGHSTRDSSFLSQTVAGGDARCAHELRNMIDGRLLESLRGFMSVRFEQDRQDYIAALQEYQQQQASWFHEELHSFSLWSHAVF